MTISAIDRAALRTISEEINEAIQAIAKRHGLEMKTAGGSYGGTSGVVKVEVTIPGRGKEVVEFERYGAQFGVQPSDLGRTILVQGQPFELAGLNTKAPKFPFLAKGADGRTYKLGADTVKRALARS